MSRMTPRANREFRAMVRKMQRGARAQIQDRIAKTEIEEVRLVTREFPQRVIEDAIERGMLNKFMIEHLKKIHNIAA